MNKLTQQDLIMIVSKKMRLLRSEYNFSQDKMAEILGISKKTLIQIEKERNQASWTLVVAICGLMRGSEILRMTLGEDPLELVETLVFDQVFIPKNITGGGRVWWKDIRTQDKFRIQKNILSGHYRIIDGNNRRWMSSFDKGDIVEKFESLLKGGKEDEEEIE